MRCFKRTAAVHDKSGFRATRRSVLSAVRAEKCLCETESTGMMLWTLFTHCTSVKAAHFILEILKLQRLHHHCRRGFVFPVTGVANNLKFLQLPRCFN